MSVAWRRILITAILFVGTAITGCGESGSDRLVAPAVELSLGENHLNETPYEQMVRLVALGLADAGSRAELLAALKESPLPEQKVLLNHHVPANRSMLRSMAAKGASAPQQLQDLIRGFGFIEAYLPVPEHRDEWAGGTNLIVAGAIGEDERLVAFDLMGRSVMISAEAAPAMPTLVVVPAEGFDAFGAPVIRTGEWRVSPRIQLDPGASTQADSDLLEPCAGMEGSYTIQCGGGGGSVGDGSTSPTKVYQRGIGVQEYISHMRTSNDHEPWYKGAPEFRLTTVGTSNFDANGEMVIDMLIPEGPWSGSDDDNNSKWRDFGSLKYAMWDTDYGTRAAFKCYEQDGGGEVTFTVSGSTTLQGVNVGFSSTFTRKDDDDYCGAHYLTPRLSTGEWTQIPANRYTGDYDGTTELQWYGFGYQH